MSCRRWRHHQTAQTVELSSYLRRVTVATVPTTTTTEMTTTTTSTVVQRPSTTRTMSCRLCYGTGKRPLAALGRRGALPDTLDLRRPRVQTPVRRQSVRRRTWRTTIRRTRRCFLSISSRHRRRLTRIRLQASRRSACPGRMF